MKLSHLCRCELLLAFAIIAGVGLWISGDKHGYNKAIDENASLMRDARRMYEKSLIALQEARAGEEFDVRTEKARLGLYGAVGRGDLPTAQEWLVRLEEARVRSAGRQDGDGGGTTAPQ
jgi:hypothetical protein